ncbi:MAG: GGDEF domain-containing protein [Thermaerobacter sp.]|nr:GGDEF domain-containing protein [Thermaerobacter sp.]
MPNRRLLTTRLEQSINRARVDGGILVVAFTDLDRFKAVNDGAVHGYGDHVLKAVATAISRQLRVGDVLARQGGDEWVLASATLDRAAYERIDALRRRLADGVSVGGQNIYATDSFGVAFLPERWHQRG